MSYKTHNASSASDQVLTLRVATRFQKLALSADPEESKGRGGPPARWREWVDATQSGGKKMVSNPNPDPISRKRHPQVSFNSALKNDAFRAKAMEAFKRWVSQADEKSKGKDRPKGKAPEGEKPEGKKEAPEGEKESPEGEAGPKKSWGDRIKGLGQKARDFVANAPKEAKRFIEDDAFRRKTLQGVHKTLTDAPEKIVKSVVKTVKHEIHEYKEAGEGISAAIHGKKMSPSQKKAVKTVAIHLAIGVAAAALTASSPLAAGGALVKGMSRRIAMKSVARALGHLHVLQEVGHIGHGVAGLMTHLASTNNPQVFLFRAADEVAEGGNPDVDDVFGNFITASVAKELESFDDESMEGSLKAMDEGDEEEEPQSEEPAEEESTDEGGDLIDEDPPKEPGDEQIVKIDLSGVSEIWFVKKDDGGAEKVASLDIVSRVVRRYRG